ncbi:MAG TPA: hypoxanthine phosphoribosyltransferase, partial [Bryobacterales bacterium]|nr:hypoxanthine phosphoribosyltransferase [Bryobacterales bacterium]
MTQLSTRPELRMLISAEQIQKRVTEMGRQIAADYPGGPLRLIAILKGACFFLSDLARAIGRDVSIDFMGIASYGRSKSSSGEVKVTKDLDGEIAGLDVLVVEDIVDTGITLTYLCQVLQQRKPKSLRIATLLDKPSRRLKPVDVAYTGFQIPDEFVVGYGLDYAERYRNLADICVLVEGPAEET